MNAKSICHVITTIERGGAENQLLILCREQIRLGSSVTVVYLKGRPELLGDFHSLGVKLIRLNSKHFVSQAIELKNLLKYRDLQIIHAHLPRSELLVSLIPQKVPIVITRHNSEVFFPKGPKWLSKILSNIAIKRSQGRIAISEGVLSFLIKSGEASKSTLFNVVPYGYVFKDKPVRQRTINISTRFLTVARLVEQKDYPTILRALSDLDHEGLAFSAKFAGEGVLVDDLKALTDKLELQQLVKWLGKVSDTDSLYANSDFFILASTYEGFGMVLLESMNWNLPIICSRIPTSEEILGDNYLGFFDPSNHGSLCETIRFALRNRNLLIAQMEERKRLFSAEVMADRIGAVYSAIYLT